MKLKITPFKAAIFVSLLTSLAFFASAALTEQQAFAADVPGNPTEVALSPLPMDIVLKSDGLYYYNSNGNSSKDGPFNPDGYVFTGSATNKTITVEPGVSTTIYLDNVEIVSTGQTYSNALHPSCINVSGANVNLVLIGTNRLSINGGASQPGVQAAALEKSGMSGSLKLSTIDDVSSTGSLAISALGPYDVAFGSSVYKAFAGDGGFSNVSFTSGVYDFTSGANAPGMGTAFGAYYHSIDNFFSNVSIGKATVTATGGANAAGIGSAGTTPVRHLDIASGAQVTATGGMNASGIGSGAVPSRDYASNYVAALDVSDITITGGRTDVKAYGANGAPAIGSGMVLDGPTDYSRAVHFVATEPMKSSQLGSEDNDLVARDWMGYADFGSAPNSVDKNDQHIISRTDYAEYLSANPAFAHFYYEAAREVTLTKLSDTNGFNPVRSAALNLKRMTGATFTVYTDPSHSTPYYVINGGTREPAKIVINATNSGSLSLPIGRYYLYETTPPADFRVDGVAHEVDVTANQASFSVFATDPPISYKVTFKDYNGNTLSTDTVPTGMAAIAPEAPSRTGYSFKGWSQNFSVVTEEMIVTAEYTINKYPVNFWVDGELVKSQQIEHGYDAVPPSTASVTKDGCLFSGWTGSYTNVTEERNITASNIAKTYTVTFKRDDGSVVDTQNVKHGHNAEPPQMGDYNNRKFLGWDRTYANITADTVITARYTSHSNFVVTFVLDGIDYDYQSIERGKAATIPTVEKEGYDFLGWQESEKCDFITTDVTIYGTTRAKTYTVTFNSPGWSYQETVDYGESVQAPQVPYRQGYTFQKWDGNYENVKQNEVVNAVWTQNKYDVTFMVDGVAKKVQTVMSGSDATPPNPATPTGYTFSGWDGNYKNVYTNETVYGENIINTYTVRFLDWNDRVIKEQQVNYGGSVEPPADPVAYDRNFLYWGGSYTNVTENRDIPAVYEEVGYTVKFLDWDDSLIKEQHVHMGEAAIPPANPVRDGWTFTAWDKDFSAVSQNIDVKAVYLKDMVTIYYQFRTGDEKGGSLSFAKRVIPSGRSIMQENVPELIVYDRWKLDGWYIDGVKYEPLEILTMMPTKDVYVTVQLTTDNAGNGDSGSTITPDDIDDRTQVIITYTMRNGDSNSPLFARKVVAKNQPLGSENVAEVGLPEGWKLDGYYVGDTKYSLSQMAAIAPSENMDFIIKTYPDVKGNSMPADPGNYWNTTDTPDGVDDRTQYTITFVNAGNAVVNKQMVNEGGTAVEAAPVSKSGGWKFVKWDGNYRNVHADATIVPLFVEIGGNTSEGTSGGSSDASSGSSSGGSSSSGTSGSGSGSSSSGTTTSRIKPDAVYYSGIAKSYKYTGKNICPRPNVRIRIGNYKYPLTFKQDYVMLYMNNKKAGTARGRIVLMGKYKGIYYFNFNIVK